VFSYRESMGHRLPKHARLIALDGSTAVAVAETMQALATPSRVRILSELRLGARPVNELAAAVEMEPSAVSHQLRILRHLGLVVGERQGRSVVYALHDSHVSELLEQAFFHVEHVRLGSADAFREAS
jgi:ArsR family transcriptional regulator, nickel/cobalt-responsive transcriptional repressor